MATIERVLPIPSAGISRRNFIFGAGALAGAALAIANGFSIPGRGPRGDYGDSIIYPGWIEDRVEAPFIDLGNKGHARWLADGVFNNPLVKATTIELFNILQNDYFKKGIRAKMGDLLGFAIQSSSEQLQRIDRKKVDQSLRDNLELEALHGGVYALAACFLTWFDERQMNDLGVSIKGHDDVDNFFWDTDGMATVSFPKFFGVDKQDEDLHLTNFGREPIWGGADRSVHVAQHLFITFNYLYARRFNLVDDLRLPNVLRWPIFLGGMRSRKIVDEARTLSDILNYGYEVKTTPKGIKGKIDNPAEMITEGLFHPTVEQDIKAGKLGREVGITVMERAWYEYQLYPIVLELNKEKYQHAETEPVLDLVA